MTTITLQIHILHLVPDMSQRPRAGNQTKSEKLRSLCFICSHFHLWFGGYVAFLEVGGEGGGDGWLRSATVFLCPKINPKSYYQEKEEKKKVSVWIFCCSGHKQQSRIKGVVGAQDLISTRFSSHKHPFSCPGPRRLFLCEADAWFAMEWPAVLLSMDPSASSDPSSLEKSQLIHAWDIWTQNGPWLGG